MKFLIDSHALIWFIEGDEKLSSDAFEVIENLQFERFVSEATLWEMAIKINLGKLKIFRPLSELPALLAAHDIQMLSISFDHILKISSLPIFHRDPFDRMLIAQAISENFTIVTRDPAFPQYGVATLW